MLTSTAVCACGLCSWKRWIGLVLGQCYSWQWRLQLEWAVPLLNTAQLGFHPCTGMEWDVLKHCVLCAQQYSPTQLPSNQTPGEMAKIPL